MLVGGRLFGIGRCSSLSGSPGPDPVVHRTVEAMSQLQEELVVLRERLALHDSDRQATTTQLQNQVPGEAGMSRGHSVALCGTGQRTLSGHLDSTRSQMVTLFWFGKILGNRNK